VTVSVDGFAISDFVIANAAAAAMLSSVENQQSIDWTTAYERGVGTAVMHRLLWLAAQRDGAAISQSDAQYLGQQQLDRYLNDQSSTRPAIAPGKTPQDIFTSPTAVAGFQESMSINAERQAIVARVLGPGFTPAQGSPVLLAWFATDLPLHQVTVAGLPAFDLSTILPNGAF
jgi:hypothetical protein